MDVDQILNLDCLSGLKNLPDNCVSLIFADPPFNLEKGYKSYSDDLQEADYETWCAEWITECVRILRPGGALFLHNIPKWLIRYCCILGNLDVEFRHWIAWDAMTSPMGKSLQPAHYGILYYVKRPVSALTFHEIHLPHPRCRSCKILAADYGGKKDMIHPQGPLASDVWRDIYRCKHKKSRNDHPCQLPVHLLERIILMASEVGDLIFDPFMGAGTTAVAAARLNRFFLGFEKDPSYAQMGLERVARQQKFSCLGPAYVSCHRGEIITVRRDDVWDSALKEYRPIWTDLFESWPTSGEDRKKLNSEKMKLKPRYLELIQELAMQLDENKKECPS